MPRYPLRDFLSSVSQGERRDMGTCLEAEAAGDPVTAVRHYVRGPYPEAAYAAFDLVELLGLGTEAPSWAYSRWIARQSYRWLAAVNDPRTGDSVVRAVASTHASLDILDPPWLPPSDPDAFDIDDEPDRDWAQEVMAREYLSNWVAFQLCVYESGGMRSFLDDIASDRLIDAADQPRAWADSRLGAYAYGWLERDTLTVLDLTSGRTCKVLHLGAASGVPESTTALGRLVPISQAPGLMFESRPLVVDPVTARQVAARLGVAGPEGWTEVLWDAVMGGRLRDGFADVGFTPLTSDLLHGFPSSETPARTGGPDDERQTQSAGEDLDPEDAARIGTLVAQGLSEIVADGVCACEILLDHTDRGPQAAPALAPIVAQYLADDEIYHALLLHLTEAKHARAWEQLSECLLAHLRPRCRVLAQACGA